MSETPQKPEPGQELHFLVSGYTCDTVQKGTQVSFVSARGQELVITPELLDANRDRLGRLPAWLEHLHDADAQVKRFGQQVVAPGPWPRDLIKTSPGETEHDEARRVALREAKSIEDRAEREAAVRSVEELYGPARPTNQTMAHYSS